MKEHKAEIEAKANECLSLKKDKDLLLKERDTLAAQKNKLEKESKSKDDQIGSLTTQLDKY